MVLLIVRIPAEIHRADNLLNERDFALSNAVFRVESLVCPLARPLLRRHKCINFPRRVLGWFVQENQEPR